MLMYDTFVAFDDLLSLPRRLALGAAAAFPHLPPKLNSLDAVRHLAAGCEVFARATISHDRPPFDIGTTVVNGTERPVHEQVELSTAFCDLLHFSKEGGAEQPRVLLVAPMSGHFATLLRETVKTLLPDHDVYLTDWQSARHVPLERGMFAFDDYVQDLMTFLDRIGPRANLIAVCQPCVAALAATAILAEGKHPAQPASLTLMAGPIDTRVNPTRVNELAGARPIDWFEDNMIQTVPARYTGAGRRVYPGHLQLSAFMSMNLPRHMKAFGQLYGHILAGEEAEAQTIRDFYAEYFAVADLPADFYLETVAKIFQDCELPRGQLTFRGRKVDPAAIRRTALLTVEGERDDICGIGQTVAAHDLCPGIRPYLKHHHVQIGVGHYGVFSGRKWTAQIYPRVHDLIRQAA